MAAIPRNTPWMPATVANCLAVAAAELRTARRLPRTWLFGVLAMAFGFVAYHGALAQFHVFSGMAAPRFAVPGLGLLVLIVLLTGLVFQAFDSRARDRRNRIVDTLDAMPISNVELIGGRLLAMAAVIWLALFATAVVLQGVGQATVYFNLLLFGEPAGLLPLAILLLLDAPPLLLFWGGLVMLLGALLRYGLPVVAVSLALIGLWVWAVFDAPLYLLPVVSGIAHLGLPGSDILPRLPSPLDLAHRLALIVAAGGFVWLAAACSPRPDTMQRRRRVRGGGTLVALAAAGIGLLCWQAVVEREERMRWARAHEAQQNAPRPDVRRVVGEVVIEPGRKLAIDVDLQVQARTPLPELRFSLNPGMRVDAVLLDDEPAQYRHELGLLTVTPVAPLASGRAATVSVRAAGVPDQRFAYLDSAIRAADEDLRGAPLATFGEQASLFESELVVLPPDVKWLPSAGANYGAEDVSERPPDFFEIDLLVRLPEGWRAAGAGRQAGSDDVQTHRFRPSVRLSAFALVAVPEAAFARRTLTVGDVEYELLIHRRHLANVEFLSRNEEVAKGTADFLAEQLALGEPGLGYPYSVLTLVEVPAQLRRYGGGRMMATVQAQPGVQFLAEHGFPSARVEARQGMMAGVPEEQRPRMTLTQVSYLGAGGVGVRDGAAQNVLPFLASATGEGAVVANYLVESLTARVLFGSHVATLGQWLQPGSPAIPGALGPVARLLNATAMASRWNLFFPAALEDRSEEVALLGIDPLASSQAMDIMVHKSNLLALSIWRLMGRTKVAELLAALRERYAGGTFTMRDFVGVAGEMEPRVAKFLEYSLLNTEAALPGFRASDVVVGRLADNDNGQPRYQIALHVRNEEPAPGVAAITWRTDPQGMRWDWSAFAQVPPEGAVEIGAVSAAPPLEVRLETYLSLNRRISRLNVPKVDPADAEEAIIPLIGSRPSGWRPRDVGIVVDDLDPGFSVVSPPPLALRFGRAAPDEAALGRGGIPELVPSQTPRGWLRQMDPNILSWGKYRRTLVRIPAGDGAGRATFAADLPAGGQWRLDYHLPGASVSEGDSRRSFEWMRFNDSFGSYDIRVTAGGREQAVTFDAATAVPGWNDLGIFDLPAGAVQLSVSDKTTGEVVVADAIRWQRVEAQDDSPEP